MSLVISHGSVKAKDAMNRRLYKSPIIIVETAIYRVFVMIYRIFIKKP